MFEKSTCLMLDDVIAAYGFPAATLITPHGSGLINRTWTLRTPGARYILQQVNEQVFTDPSLIAKNIDLVGDYLAEHHPGVLFPRQVKALDGSTLVLPGPGRYFRAFPFVEGSVTIDVVDTPAEAREAAAQFGRFARMMSGFPAETLSVTVPRFHDLSFRFQQFEAAIRDGDALRLKHSIALVEYLQSQQPLVTEFERIVADAAIPQRVTHHDTKISNILFDDRRHGLCVIDLDTVMPGYYISDVGDMFRTYLSPVSEEEKDFSLVQLRLPFFEAIVQGYLGEMQEVLTAGEKRIFVYAGPFIIYMQALRFLTDYLSGDVYYGEKYPGHNYNRAQNQATLLRQYIGCTQQLEMIARKALR